MDDDDVGADTIEDELADCPPCSGTGHTPGDSFLLSGACSLCLGKGRVSQQRRAAYIEAMETS